VKLTVLALSAALALSACGTLTNEQQGAIIGGAAGGIVGNQVGGGTGKIVATVVGTLIGVAVGSNIGRRMDEADRRKVAYALETSPSGRTTQWNNPDTNTRYEVTPRPARPHQGTVCREFTQVGYIGGKREELVGTACRQADGSWKIQ